MKHAVADGKGAGAVESGGGGDGSALQGSQRGDDLEGGRGEIAALEGAAQHRSLRIFGQLVQVGGAQGDEIIQIEAGVRSHGEDVAIAHIKNDHGPAIGGTSLEGVLGILLNLGVEGEDEVMTGLGTAAHFLAELGAIGTENEVHHAGLAAQALLERGLESGAAHGLQDGGLALDDGAGGRRLAHPGVADDMAGAVALGIVALVGGLKHEPFAEQGLDLVLFLVGEADADVAGLGEDQRQPAAVLVVRHELVIRDVPGRAEQLVHLPDAGAGKSNDILALLRLQHGEVQREVINHLVLGKAHAVAIDDLSTRASHFEHHGARILHRQHGGGEVRLGLGLVHGRFAVFVQRNSLEGHASDAVGGRNIVIGLGRMPWLGGLWN